MKKLLAVALLVGVVSGAPAHADEAAAIRVCGSKINLELVCAVQRGQAENIPVLIERGASVDTTVPSGWTLLMLAAHNGHTKCVKALLASGADKSAKTSDGATALFLAQLNEHEECVGLLG